MKLEIVESMNGIINIMLNTINETDQKNDLMGTQFIKNSTEANELIKALNNRLTNFENKNKEIKQFDVNR